LFFAVNVLGIISACILLLSRLFIFGLRQFHRYWRSWLLLVMMLMSVAFIGYIQPEMQMLKQAADLASAERFADLHRLSENLYMLLSLFGLMLVLTTDKRSEANDVA
jgi:hypothetical protein